MMNWLFGTPERVTVQLIAENDARTLPGFHNGGLTLIATKGTTFAQLLINFNTYRGPDSQIAKLFTLEGAEIPLRTVITEPAVCKVLKV